MRRRVVSAVWKGLGAAAIAVPMAALVVGAVADRGPDGVQGPSAFHLALAAFDPSIRAAALNSGLVAAGVALGSIVLGVALAALARGRFAGRGVLVALGAVPLAVPPLVGAMGLGWGARRLGFDPWAEGSAAAWVVLVVAELGCGVAWVVRSVAGPLSGLDPTWASASRASGSSAWRVWWSLSWPIVRPAAARAGAEVFALCILEPGAPLALGLRRTLAFQAVEAAAGATAGPRSATLGVAALLLAAVAARLSRAWARDRRLSLSSPRPGRDPGLQLALARWPLLGAWAFCATLPLWLLAREALDGGLQTAIRALVGDPSIRNAAAWSSLLGVAAATLAASLGRSAQGWTLPPLAIALGVLHVPWLWAVADAALGPGAGLGRLNLPAIPGVLLVWAVALSSLQRRSPEGPDESKAIEASVGRGQSRRRARRSAAGPFWRAPAVATWLCAATLAATDTAAAFILAPTATLGPAFLRLATMSDLASSAAVLGLGIAAVNLAAIAVASRSVGSTGGRLDDRGLPEG